MATSRSPSRYRSHGRRRRDASVSSYSSSSLSPSKGSSYRPSYPRSHSRRMASNGNSRYRRSHSRSPSRGRRRHRSPSPRSGSSYKPSSDRYRRRHRSRSPSRTRSRSPAYRSHRRDDNTTTSSRRHRSKSREPSKSSKSSTTKSNTNTPSQTVTPPTTMPTLTTDQHLLIKNFINILNDLSPGLLYRADLLTEAYMAKHDHQDPFKISKKNIVKFLQEQSIVFRVVEEVAGEKFIGLTKDFDKIIKSADSLSKSNDETMKSTTILSLAKSLIKPLTPIHIPTLYQLYNYFFSRKGLAPKITQNDFMKLITSDQSPFKSSRVCEFMVLWYDNSHLELLQRKERFRYLLCRAWLENGHCPFRERGCYRLHPVKEGNHDKPVGDVDLGNTSNPDVQSVIAQSTTSALHTSSPTSVMTPPLLPMYMWPPLPPGIPQQSQLPPSFSHFPPPHPQPPPPQTTPAQPEYVARHIHYLQQQLLSLQAQLQLSHSEPMMPYQLQHATDRSGDGGGGSTMKSDETEKDVTEK